MTRAEAAEAARDQNGADLASSKRLHQSLMRRVKPLLMALREKGAESVKLGATLADMERRFLTYQSEAGDMIRALQDRETQLVADLEAERARRVVAEGRARHRPQPAAVGDPAPSAGHSLVARQPAPDIRRRRAG